VSSDSAPAKIVYVSNTILIQNKCKNIYSVLVSYYKICFKTVIGFLNMFVCLRTKLAAFIHLANRWPVCVGRNMRESLKFTNKNSDSSGVQRDE